MDGTGSSVAVSVPYEDFSTVLFGCGWVKNQIYAEEQSECTKYGVPKD